MSAKLLLHLMACKWHPKYGWQRGQNSIARLMAVSNSTATHALQQLLALGVIYEAEPGRGRRAPRYDFGPNRVDVVEPLHPVKPDEKQTDLDPADVDATDALSNSVTRMQNPPLYPEEQDAFGIRVADGTVLGVTGDADEWDGFVPVPPGEI
ncbi:hypothetical protein [Ruegeria atlantica]|uniref:hypothetical protein n=1 Tax=Ruegeria atlantica TaxID=81569 RepID=UPI0024959944|nr:hypothetical protein [Ruegeria atlantica]